MMQLEKNWKKSWKWFSMQALLLATTVQTAWISLPDDMKALFYGEKTIQVVRFVVNPPPCRERQ